MGTGLLQFRLFAGPDGQGWQQDWGDVYSADTEWVLWPIEARAIPEELIAAILPSTQCTPVRFVADRGSRSLLALFDSNCEKGMHNIARLCSRTWRPAWL